MVSESVGQKYTSLERRLLLIGVCIPLFLSQFLITSVNIALPMIGEQYSLPTTQLPLLSSIYLLGSIVAIVPLARIADIYGRKKLFSLGIGILGVSSLLAAISPSYDFLLLCRLISGIGCAIVTGNGITLVASTNSLKDRGTAIGYTVSSSCLGDTAGPAIGGIIVEFLGWQSLFYIPAILSFLVIGVLHISMKHDIIDCVGERFDLKGSAIYVIMITLFAFGMLNLPIPWSFILIAISVLVILPILMLVELKIEKPVINPYLISRNLDFLKSILTRALRYCASFPISFFLSLYLQYVGLLTTISTGLIIIISPLTQALLSPVVGELSNRIESRILCIIGLITIAISILLLIIGSHFVNIASLCCILILVGVGCAFASTPNNNMTLDAVDRKDYGSANSIASTMRQIGMLVAMGIATCMCSLFMGLNISITFDMSSFILAMHVSFIIGIIAALIGAYFAYTYKTKIVINTDK